MARKIPVRKGTTTCQCFKAIRQHDRQPHDPRPLALITDPDQACQRLRARGLLWAIQEIGRIDGHLAIRYHPAAELEDMGAVVRCLVAGPSWTP